MKLHSLETPPAEFDHVEKGDALYGNKFISQSLALMSYDCLCCVI